MRRRTDHPRLLGAAVLLTAFAAPVAAVHADPTGPPRLQVESVEPPAAATLAEALALRLGEPVAAVDPGDPAAPEAWRLRVTADGAARVLRLESPAGDVWHRTVDVSPDADAEAVTCTVALAAGYLFALANAPFALAAAIPPPPPPPVGPPPVDSPPDPTGTVDPPPPPTPPVETPPPGPLESLVVGVQLLAGAGDLDGPTEGAHLSSSLNVRPYVEWPWGLWLLVECGWRHRAVEDPEPLALHAFPLRAGLGVSLPLAETVHWHLGFLAVLEWWRTTGGVERSGFRSGGGAVIGATWRIASWMALVLDVGADLLPHAVELVYRDRSVFSLGSWRWRALAGFSLDLPLEW
jgi:hypothetical protein